MKGVLGRALSATYHKRPVSPRVLTPPAAVHSSKVWERESSCIHSAHTTSGLVLIVAEPSPAIPSE